MTCVTRVLSSSVLITLRISPFYLLPSVLQFNFYLLLLFNHSPPQQVGVRCTTASIIPPVHISLVLSPVLRLCAICVQKWDTILYNTQLDTRSNRTPPSATKHRTWKSSSSAASLFLVNQFVSSSSAVRRLTNSNQPTNRVTTNSIPKTRPTKRQQRDGL